MRSEALVKVTAEEAQELRNLLALTYNLPIVQRTASLTNLLERMTQEVLVAEGPQESVSFKIGIEPEEKLEVRVRACGPWLEIMPAGYGEMTAIDGEGSPVALEFAEDGLGLRLHVWEDINEEQPTISLSLEGAREDKREE